MCLKINLFVLTVGSVKVFVLLEKIISYECRKIILILCSLVLFLLITEKLTTQTDDFQMRMYIYAEKSKRYICFTKRWKMVAVVSLTMTYIINNCHLKMSNLNFVFFLFLFKLSA